MTTGRFVTRESQRRKAKNVAVGFDLSGQSAADLAELHQIVVHVERFDDDGHPLPAIRLNTLSGQTVTQDGSDGSQRKEPGAVFIVKGNPDIRNFRFVSAVYGRVAEIVARFEGGTT